MVGPPLIPSPSSISNANVKKDDKPEDKPCPKRRRKSIDDTTTATAPPTTTATAPNKDAGAGPKVTQEKEQDHGETASADADAVISRTPLPEDSSAAATKEGQEGQGGGDDADGMAVDATETAGRTTDDEQAEGAEAEQGEEGQDHEEEEEEEEGEEEEDEEEEGEGEAGVAASPPSGEKPDGSKIARARSAWMLFLADNREGVRKEHPGLAVGPMQKILSEMWKGLGEAEVARYAKLAAEDKERVKNELAAAGLTKLPTKNSSSAAVAGGPTSLVLPLARVRKTVRLDPSVGNISKEGLLLVTKATEVFMAVLADHAWKIGRQTGRKSVRPCDVADFVFAAPEMYWLKDEFREERSSVKKKQSRPEASGAKAAGTTKAGVTAVPKGAKPITSFFQKA
ncbi:unnamed protein product [Ectocarpus sp. 6 AP-2014]